jgi:hypothetical protein
VSTVQELIEMIPTMETGKLEATFEWLKSIPQGLGDPERYKYMRVMSAELEKRGVK